MLSDARRNLIKNKALNEGEIIISEIAEELGVSFETVRRDINILCRENVLEKVHGGAVPVKVTDYEDKYQKRKDTNPVTKNRLGAEVAKRLENEKIIMISSGTTLEAVAQASKDLKNGLVITNSFPVAENFGKLSENGNEVFLAGGKLNAEERFTYGAEAVNHISRYSADVAVVSCVGIDAKGAMCSGVEEGNIIFRMMKSASKVILVADSSKFGKKSVYRFCKISDIDEIITDNKTSVPELLKKSAKKCKTKISVVDAG